MVFLGYQKIKEKNNLPGLNKFARYEKRFSDGRLAIIDMMATDTDVNSPDNLFLFLKKAIEEYEIISYNGHSGQANLDLDAMNKRLASIGSQKIKFNQKYQIIFFNGCSTYSYYNKKYFKAKKGVKTLKRF